MKTSAALLMTLLSAAPLAAQTRGQAAAPDVSLRGFAMAAGEQFTATKTFDTVFGAQSMRPFFGGGVQILLRQGVFGEVAFSRFSQTGQRAFVIDGTAVTVGVPLTLTVTPIDFVGGYRFKLTKLIVPYLAGGVTRYAYRETSSFDDAGEGVDVSGTGFVVMGGAEIRLHRWVGVAVDLRYARVKEIIGGAGISKAFNEDDLGGTALRVKAVVGR